MTLRKHNIYSSNFYHFIYILDSVILINHAVENKKQHLFIFFYQFIYNLYEGQSESSDNGPITFLSICGALWCSGKASDSRSRGTGFDPH